MLILCSFLDLLECKFLRFLIPSLSLHSLPNHWVQSSPLQSVATLFPIFRASHAFLLSYCLALCFELLCSFCTSPKFGSHADSLRREANGPFFRSFLCSGGREFPFGDPFFQDSGGGSTQGPIVDFPISRFIPCSPERYCFQSNFHTHDPLCGLRQENALLRRMLKQLTRLSLV